MTTLLILFVIAAVTGGMLWFGAKGSKQGVFVLHLLIGFGCVEGAAHLLRMSDLAYVESIHSSANVALILVAVILLTGLGALGLRNKEAANASRYVHAGAGLAALLVVFSITRQL